MSRIEVRDSSGKVETQKLSKSQPISIGRHASNDICVDEDDVATMHCRISWNQNNYEVSAANPNGVDLNGTLIRHAPLRTGDVLRVGSIDVVFESDEPESSPPSEDAGQSQSPKSEEIKLAPISSQSVPSFFQRPESSLRAMAEPARRPEPSGTGPESGRRSSQRPSERPGPKNAERVDLDRVDEDMDELARASKDSPVVLDDADDEDDFEQPELSRGTGYVDRQTAGPPSRVEAFKRRLGIRPVRPGEQDSLRSPVVLALGGTAAAAALVAAVLWFTIGRQTAERAYQAAVDEFGQGKYAQSIQLFNEFLRDYPRSRYTELARVGLGKSQIEKEISGSTPSWSRGLEELQDFIRDHRDRPGFSERQDAIRGFAQRIVLGAARSAESLKRRDLLAISSEAETLVQRYSPEGEIAAELRDEIRRAQRLADAAIVKQETFDTHVARIEAALESDDPMTALETRIRLLTRYPEFGENTAVSALLDETLETERGLVVREEADRNAVTTERPSVVPRPLSLTPHRRSRTADESSGRTVVAMAKNCCYGIDSVTGAPLWRRVVGFDAPFFPMPVSTTVPGLLLFDTDHGELILLDRTSGQLAWRQPLEEQVAGPPLVHEGQIYLPTHGRHLYKLDLESGYVSTRVRFSQEVLAPAVLVSEGERIIVTGERAVLYTLSSRKLECESVAYIGHLAGSVNVPLLTLGSLVLMIENDRADSARLRVLETGNEECWLDEVATARVEGQVHDPPILRGKQLFITSTPERIAAFTVSDDPEQRTLTQVARIQVPTAQPGPMYLTPGPDGEFWVASSAVRKFRLKTENIQPSSSPIAVGLSTQPLQTIGQQLFIGRRNPWNTSVLFSQADRDSMTSHWSTVLGSAILAWGGSSNKSAVCVSESGEIFRIRAGDVERGGYVLNSTTRLPIPDSATSPLRAVSFDDGSLAAFAGEPEPYLWLVNSLGQIERRMRLEKPLEADPIRLETGVVLPLPGKLKFIALSGSAGRVEDFLAPVDTENPARWSRIAPLDSGQFVTLNRLGRLARIQLRTSPAPAHLAEVVTRQLDASVDVDFHVVDQRLYVADASGRLQVLDVSTMETLGETQLERPASNKIWGAGDRIFVESGRHELLCFSSSEKLDPLWAAPLDGVGLAGSPLVTGHGVIVAKSDGNLLALNAQNGSVMKSIDLNQPVTLGVRTLGQVLVVPTIDGSIYPVGSSLQ